MFILKNIYFRAKTKNALAKMNVAIKIYIK